MNMFKFTKMQGAGNDYIYIDARKTSIPQPGKLSVKMSNRHFGIGSDGLILILKSGKADFRMRMFNPDGSEAEMCGNGIRCFAKYVFDRGLTNKKSIAVETMAGIRQLDLFIKKGKVDRVKVDMGEPVFERKLIPMLGDPGKVIDEIILLNGVRFIINAVSMGNPHVVIYVEDVHNFPVDKYGPMIECHTLFPKRTNIEFVQIAGSNEVFVRTWERGTGETLACGTGASAVTAAGILSGKTSRKLTIHLLGGVVETEWNERDNHIYLTGPTAEVFNGEWSD